MLKSFRSHHIPRIPFFFLFLFPIRRLFLTCLKTLAQEAGLNQNSIVHKQEVRGVVLKIDAHRAPIARVFVFLKLALRGNLLNHRGLSRSRRSANAEVLKQKCDDVKTANYAAKTVEHGPDIFGPLVLHIRTSRQIWRTWTVHPETETTPLCILCPKKQSNKRDIIPLTIKHKLI